MTSPGKFELQKHLGAGSFGDVYLGIDSVTNKQVAVKLEKKDARHQQLLLEAKLYRMLKGSRGIPEVYTYGVDGEYNVLVMDLLGASLESCFRAGGKHMSLKSALMVIEQVIERVETLHKHNFLHRDIKPDNFLMGTGKDAGKVFMIDLGLAKKFKSTTTHVHIPFREGKSLTGTARFASIATHMGWEQSRRDDMVAIGYMLMYFIRGNLPWQGLQLDPKDCKDRDDKYKPIKAMKMSTSVEDLCEGQPEEFVKYFKYVDTLGFEEKPDYAYCRDLLRECAARHELEFDYVYDWTDANKSSDATPKSRSARSPRK